MKKVFLILALAVALAAPAALAEVSTSSSPEREEDSRRLQEAGKIVEEKVKANAPPEEIAAAVEEVKKIYEEIRAKNEAETARLRALGESGQ
jgi:hypothetical protein